MTSSVLTAVVLVLAAGAADLPLSHDRFVPIAFRPSPAEAECSFFLCCQAPSHAAGQFSFFLGLEFIFARTLLSSRFSARVQVSAGQWSRSVRRQIFGPDPIICSASIRPLIFAAGLG